MQATGMCEKPAGTLPRELEQVSGLLDRLEAQHRRIGAAAERLQPLPAEETATGPEPPCQGQLGQLGVLRGRLAEAVREAERLAEAFEEAI